MPDSSSSVSPAAPPDGPALPSRRRFRRMVLAGAGVLTLGLLGLGYSFLSRVTGTTNPVKNFQDARLALFDPRQSFPGRDHLNILCVGLDRNVFTTRDPRLKYLNGMPYTRGARSDVLMLVSLDLVHRTAGILSIPRDSRVRLPGKRRFAKVNEAHADGGVPYAREAVSQLLGVPVDYHVVIKQEAVESVVDALGGLRVRVDHDLDYDDNWGQLHVHLKEGERDLTGKEVAGFMRFRHDREGDLGRIRRQQQVIQRLTSRAKDPLVLLKAEPLIAAVRRNVETDLTPQQQLALAHLFHQLQPGSIQALALPVADTPTIRGVSYVVLDEGKKQAAVDWLVRQNEEALNRLIRVEVRNGTGDRALGLQVTRRLREQGFTVVARSPRDGAVAQTRIIQRTRLRDAGEHVRSALALTEPVESGTQGEQDVTLVLGTGSVQQFQKQGTGPQSRRVGLLTAGRRDTPWGDHQTPTSQLNSARRVPGG